MVRRAILVLALVACHESKPAVDITPTAVSAKPVASAPPPVVVKGDVKKIVAGNAHNCALLASGQIACWGRETGPVANGYRTNLLKPTISPHVKDAIDVAVGAFHVCALRKSGDVLCWGEDRDIGFGHSFSLDEPPVAIPNLKGIVEIVAHDHHTCARRDDGHVLCFGLDEGQLGGPGPVAEVPNLADAVQIGASYYRSCARRASGAVTCWGKLDGPENLADPFPNVRDVVSMSMAEQVCVARANGDALCEWGFDEKREGRRVVVDHDVVQVAVGMSFVCMVHRDGKVKCLGENRSGQLGDGTTTDRSTAVEVAGLASVAQIAAGQSHACALLASGDLRCWGDNWSAELGIGSDENVRVPTKLPGVPGNAKIVTRSGQTCALVDKALRCWGIDNAANVAFENYGKARPKLEGTSPSGVTSLVDVALGGSVEGIGCGVTPNAEVSCWGDLLGLGASFPYKPDNTPHVIANTKNAVEVVFGEMHGCARRKDGHVVCWGHDEKGQLGNNGSKPNASAVEVKGLDGVIWLSAGASHTCAIRKGGEVVCWGSNESGQTGRFDVNGEGIASPTPKAVPKIKARALAAGQFHTCALGTDDHVTCWGASYFKAAAHVMSHRSCKPADDCAGLRFYTPPKLTDAVAIGAGGFETCVVHKTGALGCWSGGGGGRDHEEKTISVEHATGVSVAGLHACAVTTDGVQCWGQNREGEIGGAELPYRTKPVTPIWPPK